LGMVDENDLRPDKLPFPGLFVRCGEQQVHILELPNPDPNTVNDRPGYGKDRRTAYSVKDLKPLRAALDGAGVPYAMDPKQTTLWCYDPDANEQMFIKDESIQPIMEAYDGPMVPWTRLWDP
jgi:glyoxylase I family protein